MGFFDSILGLGTNKSTLANSRAMNGEIWRDADLNNRLISDAAQYAKADVIQGTNDALSSISQGADQAVQYAAGGTHDALGSLVDRYLGARSDVQGFGTAAQGVLTDNTGQAMNRATGSNAMFQPYADTGTAANGMLTNALGLNGAAGNAAATAAFQASPGYQYQVDQATDAAARKAASLGMAASGNTLTAITRLGSDLADQRYGSFLDRLTGQSSQGLSAAGAMSGNNALASNFQYGAGTNEANMINAEGSLLGSLGTGLGTAQSNLQSGLGTTLGTVASQLGVNRGNLQSGMGTALGNLETNRANQSVNNIWSAVNAVNGNTMGAAQAQDRTDSSNNGIFTKLLMGGSGPSGGSGIFGTLLSGFKL